MIQIYLHIDNGKMDILTDSDNVVVHICDYDRNQITGNQKLTKVNTVELFNAMVKRGQDYIYDRIKANLNRQTNKQG
jgi:urate oxidase